MRKQERLLPKKRDFEATAEMTFDFRSNAVAPVDQPWYVCDKCILYHRLRRPLQSQASLALVPSTAAGETHISHASTSKLNAQGLHDTLTYGPRSIAAEVAPQHPLEQRLTQVRRRVSRAARTLAS